jgi:hypothetical protein
MSTIVITAQFIIITWLKPGIFLQDAVNDFLAEKDEKIIAVHPVMEKTLLVHYKE